MKRFFKVCLVPLLSLAVFFGIFALYKTGIISFRKFPGKAGPKQIVLNCDYNGQKVSLTDTLYQTTDEYYKDDPKKYLYSMTEGYQSFTKSYQEDKTIQDLSEKIAAKGKQLGLDSDRTADLATCFVQNIPYDKEKARIVLSGNILSSEQRKISFGRFPYETLYDNKGICTDKSYLEAAILKQMGYGTSLMVFDGERHMAVGIKTLKGYTSFDTDYSYVETTNTGFKVGQLPSIDKEIGGAQKPEIDRVAGISNVNTAPSLIPNLPEPNFPKPSKIYKVADGKSYERVAEIAKELARLKILINEINAANQELVSIRESLKEEERDVEASKKQMESMENKVAEAEAAYKGNPTNSNYANYQEVYAQYTANYNLTKKKIDNYNLKIKNYNSKVQEINNMIEEYNKLLKSS